MIDPTRNGARSQIKPDLRTSSTQRQMLLLNQQVSMRAAGEDACLMIIFGQQGMIEVQTSEAQGRRILMFIFFIIINCCLIFSEMLTPVVGGQISAGQPEGGETQSIAGSVLVGAPSLPGRRSSPEDFFGQAIKQIVGGVALGNFVAGKIKLQCYRLEQLTSKVL